MAQGKRIDTGPTNVVADRQQVSGNVEIVNGLSCMYCHSQGMKTGVTDIVRSGTAIKGKALDLVQRLYRDKAERDTAFEKDSESFRHAALAAMTTWARDSNALLETDGSLVEPITDVAKSYAVESLDLEQVARKTISTKFRS